MLVHLGPHTVGIAFDRMFILISVQRDVAAPISLIEGLPTASRRCTPLQKWRMKRVTDQVDAHLSRRITLADMGPPAAQTPRPFPPHFPPPTACARPTPACH